MKRNWTKYTTWTKIVAGYCFDENGEVIIKVFSKLPKRFYYSACNEAASYFEEVIKPKQEIENAQSLEELEAILLSAAKSERRELFSSIPMRFTGERLYHVLRKRLFKTTPYKVGQIAKFHTPLPDENPNQLYVVLEIIEDERPRADIMPLNTRLSFPPINTVRLGDLEVVEGRLESSTMELLGQNVTINKSDHSQASGEVVKVSEQEIILGLTKGVKGVETNVYLTIKDDQGQEHTGTLCVINKTN